MSITTTTTFNSWHLTLNFFVKGQVSTVKSHKMRCPICGKSSRVYGTTKKLRGHKNPTGKRRRQPNLQWVTIPENVKLPRGADPSLKGKRIKACTKCIKALYAQAK